MRSDLLYPFDDAYRLTGLALLEAVEDLR